MRMKLVLVGSLRMRTSLELPDSLFARLKARAACTDVYLAAGEFRS